VHAGRADARACLGDQPLALDLVLTAPEVAERLARQLLGVAVDLGATHGGQEAQLALAEPRDRPRGGHGSVEDDGYALRPVLAFDGFDEIVECLPVLGTARQGAPAQRVAVLVAQKQDADLVSVVEALLGAAALGEVWATPFEPGISYVGEERRESAIALLVPAHEPVL
jgi:hypothetical protein